MLKGVNDILATLGDIEQRLAAIEQAALDMSGGGGPNGATAIAASLEDVRKALAELGLEPSEYGGKLLNPDECDNRVTRIRCRDGGYAVYALVCLSKCDPGPRPTDINAAAIEPDGEFLRLPLVIKTEQGEYLGLPGRTKGKFSIMDFLFVMDRQNGGDDAPMSAGWRQEGDTWLLSLSWGDAGRKHDMEFRTTTTPTGNQVAWLQRLIVGENEAGPEFLQQFLKSLRREGES